MDRIIKADLFRYGGLSGKKGFLKGLKIPGFRYMYLLRKISKSKKYSLSYIIYTFLLKRYSFKYGFQIPPVLILVRDSTLDISGQLSSMPKQG